MRFIAVLLSIVILGCDSTSSRADDLTPSSGPASAEKSNNVIESFSVEPNGDLLLIPVTIANREYKFCLDTGFTTSVVDTTLHWALEKTDETDTFNGKDVEIFRCPKASVGSSQLQLAGQVLCLDLKGMREATRHDYFGILGMGFLRQHVVQIDFDAGRVSFLRSSEGAPGEKLPMGIDSAELPTVLVRLPIVGDTPFMIDTGNVGLLNGKLSTVTFDTLFRGGQATMFSNKQPTFGIKGVREGRRGVVSKFSVGSFRHDRQKFGESDQNYLSLGYLSRYLVTFDFAEQQICLAKGKNYDRAFPRCTFGFGFGPNDATPVVENLGENSWGFRSGIRPGDRLIAIDGHDTRTMTLYAVESLLEPFQDNPYLEVTVERLGNSRDIRLSRKQRPDREANAPKLRRGDSASPKQRS